MQNYNKNSTKPSSRLYFFASIHNIAANDSGGEAFQWRQNGIAKLAFRRSIYGVNETRFRYFGHTFFAVNQKSPIFAAI